jgi:hypothetical protein
MVQRQQATVSLSCPDHVLKVSLHRTHLSCNTPLCSQSESSPPLLVIAYSPSAGASTPKRRATCAGGQSVQNEACCVWFPVLEDILPNMFDNECGDDVRCCVRRVLCITDRPSARRTGHCVWLSTTQSDSRPRKAAEARTGRSSSSIIQS